MHICKTTHGIDGTYENNTQTARQNIRCMTMFEGAFMDAAGNHIGIGYGSCGGMAVGKPISTLSEKLFKRKVPMKYEAVINMVFFALLMGLMLLVTFNDVRKLISQVVQS